MRFLELKLVWKYLECGTKNLEKPWNLRPKTLRKPGICKKVGTLHTHTHTHIHTHTNTAVMEIRGIMRENCTFWGTIKAINCSIARNILFTSLKNSHLYFLNIKFNVFGNFLGTYPLLGPFLKQCIHIDMTVR